MKAPARPPVADNADAFSRVSQINTSLRKLCCHSSADHKHRYSECPSVRRSSHTTVRNNKSTDSRNSGKRAHNIRSDNNIRYHTLLRKGSPRIRPETPQLRLRKALTVEILDCGAWIWILLSFSSDGPPFVESDFFPSGFRADVHIPL